MESFTSLTVVDITILGTLLIAFLIGWGTGIIRFLTGFLSFIIAVFVAGRYSHFVIDWLNQTWDLQGWMEGVLTRRINLPSEASQVPVNQVPFETALNWLKAVPLPEAYKQPLAQQLTEWSASAAGKTAAEFLIEQIATGLVNAVVFAMMVMFLSLFLGYLGRFIADQVQEIPLIGTADRLLGASALVLQTALILSFLTVFAVPALSVYGAAELGQAFNEAKTTPYLVQFFEWIRGLLFGGGTKLWKG
ncbi:MAG: CvpA family protein [Bacillota bacterium]